MAPQLNPRVANVALPLPRAQPYTYVVPTELADRVRPGSRVLVPVRQREMVGVVLDLDLAKEDTKLKPILLVPDELPLVPEKLLELARWMSSYYLCSIGITLKSMMPGALWGRSKIVVRLEDRSAAARGRSREVIDLLRGRREMTTTALARKLKRSAWDVVQRLSAAGAVSLEVRPADLGPEALKEKHVVLQRPMRSLLERDEVFRRAPQQLKVYQALDAMGGEAPLSKLRHSFGFSRSVIGGLVDKGIAVIEERQTHRDPFGSLTVTAPERPSPDQENAIARIKDAGAGNAVTLFGVTGSGKTLVYLEALREDVERGRGAIVLVPEISLTPQTISRVRGVFGEQVTVLHSSLSHGERADAWRSLVAGEKRVVVGARSAVFAPVSKLAAVVIDEEHDSSYKNGEAPRYHTRDVALRRAQMEGARVISGSATPSLEVWHARDRMPVVRLPERPHRRPLPPVEILDLRSEPQVSGSGPVPWSERLDREIEHRLGASQQVILLLNRRGYAHFVQCRACGHVVECDNCSIAMTVHRVPRGLRCHYCGDKRFIPSECPQCGGAQQQSRGFGTQLLERWLTQRYAGARMARMDADTTTSKWSHHKILDAFGRGEVNLLFGTQMIAKGLDFPNVTLVGVVDADTSLHLPDFRSAERTFQMIAQVSGRAGRGPRGGVVLVQTRSPSHFAFEVAARHDYEAFAEAELRERLDPPYPPHVAIINLLLSGTVEAEVVAAAEEMTDWLKALASEKSLVELDIVGPAPAPLAKIKGRWRWHLVLRSRDRSLLGRVARYALEKGPVSGRSRVRLIFDRDPVSLL